MERGEDVLLRARIANQGRYGPPSVGVGIINASPLRSSPPRRFGSPEKVVVNRHSSPVGKRGGVLQEFKQTVELSNAYGEWMTPISPQKNVTRALAQGSSKKAERM